MCGSRPICTKLVVFFGITKIFGREAFAHRVLLSEKSVMAFSAAAAETADYSGRELLLAEPGDSFPSLQPRH